MIDLPADRQAPAAHCLGIGHLRAADAREVAVHQIGAHFAFQHLIAPVADVLEDQQAQHHFGRSALSAAAATLGMPLRQSVVDGRHQLFVLKHLVGVDHPILAQITHLLGDQSVAEAELRAPHFNHGSSSGVFDAALSGRNSSMIEFADGLDRLLEVLIIAQPAAHLVNPFAAQAELPGASTRIGHCENRQRVAFAARAFCTSAGVITDGPLQQRAAQNLAGHRETVEKLLAPR